MTGYIIHYTDRDGEKTDTTVADSDELTIEHCGENVNTSIAALSQYLPSEPQIIDLTLRKIITRYVMSWLRNMIVLTLVTFNIDLSWLSVMRVKIIIIIPFHDS